MSHLFNYEWTLKDANFTKDKGTDCDEDLQGVVKQ